MQSVATTSSTVRQASNEASPTNQIINIMTTVNLTIKQNLLENVGWSNAIQSVKSFADEELNLSVEIIISIFFLNIFHS